MSILQKLETPENPRKALQAAESILRALKVGLAGCENDQERLELKQLITNALQAEL